MIEKRLEYQPADFIEASIAATTRRWLSWRHLLSSAALIVLLPLAITWWNNGDNWSPLLWVSGILIILGISLLAYPLVLLYSWWWGARMLSRHPHLRHTLHLQISDAGISLSGQQGNWTHPWSDFTDLVERRRVIMLMLGPKMFFCLPKRILDDADIGSIRAHFAGRR